jgi:hypothetical protein
MVEHSKSDFHHGLPVWRFKNCLHCQKSADVVRVCVRGHASESVQVQVHEIVVCTSRLLLFRNQLVFMANPACRNHQPRSRYTGARG